MTTDYDSFEAIGLALTLPKGFAIEYKQRNWFDQVYFGMISMSQEQRGYRPILYQFELDHDKKYGVPLPSRILLTFYQPEKKRISQLVGIVIIGGQPDIYAADTATKILTPHLESLLIDKHSVETKLHENIIEETLIRVSSPIKVKSIVQILETSERKEGEKLATFFPILADEDFQQKKLSLPHDFQVDGAFVFGLNDDFFTTDEIGGGLETLSLYAKEQGDKTINGGLSFPLIIKWQPVYNDILTQLKKTQNKALPQEYGGKIKPAVVIFHQERDNSYTALISTVTTVQDQQFYNVAVARSGYHEGKPLSFLLSALSREKFGEDVWVRRMREHDFSEDALFIDWKNLLDKIALRSEGKFDIGIIRALKR